MANEIIERVAKAMAKVIADRHSDSDPDYWMGEARREEAKAAIEAMKPATDEQQAAYYEMCLIEGYNKNAVAACFPNAVWERAIDAALKE